jgi:ABC-type dipeptide/oligopeptide/nickel transport system permease subunit
MNLLLGLRRKGSIQSQKRTLWKRFFGDKLVVLGAVIVVGFLLIALLGPYIAPYDYAEQFRPQGSGLLPLDVMSTARTGEFLILGSDALGRDMLSRLIYGTRTTIVIAMSSVMVASFLAIVVGSIAGYLEGSLFDEIIMRIIDALLTFPGILLALILVAAWGSQGIDIGTITVPPEMTIAIALAFTLTPRLTRTMRGSTIPQAHRAYIKAAQLMGMPAWRIVIFELIPNCLTAVVIQAATYLGLAVFTTAGLGFLGLGPPEPQPELGKILARTQEYFLTQRFWHIFIPGFTVSMLVFGFSILGDGIRNILDPEYRFEEA